MSLLMLTAHPAIVRAQDDQTIALSTAQKAVYTAAVQSFRERRYSAAYGRFAQLADAGHVPSAQLALVMVSNGPTLFGTRWSVAPDQQRRWSALVINSTLSSLHFVDD
jgi:hypothetical protein